MGFVNVPWDGLVHAFSIDLLVAKRVQRQGIGRRLIEVAAGEAREAGCEWLQVDFDEQLEPFYLDACDFERTEAGLIRP